MTPVRVWHHPSFGAHDPGPGHADAPERLRAAREGCPPGVVWVEAPLAEPGDLEAVHDADHIADVRAAEGRRVRFDPDTRTSEASVDAALRAAGAAARAADRLVDGEPSFVLARPPGHHATRARAMGFCLFNAAAIAAARLRRHGRVLVFDPDVHHGNGTQEIFWEDPDVLYVSMHRFPFYPGSGAAHERGAGLGAGATRNVPLPAGATDAVYLSAFERLVRPVVDAFAPDFVVVSAGYDALRGDPLGGMALTEGALADLWRGVCAGRRAMAVLEGGYDLGNLQRGVAATLPVLGGG